MTKKKKKLIPIEQLIENSDVISPREEAKLEALNDELDVYFDLIDTEQLLNEPDIKPPWLIEGMLPLAGTSLWAGREKVGKTTLIRQLCLSVATGYDFLGREVRKGKVLYLALEENRDFLRADLKAMCNNGPKNLYWHFGGIHGDKMKGLKAFITKMRPSLIVIDTMMKFLKLSNLNDYGETVNAMNPLTELARKYECHMLYVHHMNKSKEYSRGNYDDRTSIMGSVATQCEVDTIVAITKDFTASDRYIQSTQRYGRNLGKTRLRFDDSTKMSYMANFCLDIKVKK